VAARRAGKPSEAGPRYEFLSGGRLAARVHYVARRHLSMSHEQWDDLPWWQQIDYLIGLETDGLITLNEQDETDPVVELGMTVRTVHLPE